MGPPAVVGPPAFGGVLLVRKRERTSGIGRPALAGGLVARR